MGYSTEDIERGLWAVALNAGSVTRAARDLEAQGHQVTKQTLHGWKTDQHADRYEQIQAEAQANISDRVAAEAEAFLLASAETERLILTKLHQAVEDGELKPSDLSGSLRNLATSRALSNDKIIGPLRGRAQIVEHRHTADELLRRLETIKPKAIESTAEEVTDTRLDRDSHGLNARELEAGESPS